MGIDYAFALANQRHPRREIVLEKNRVPRNPFPAPKGRHEQYNVSRERMTVRGILLTLGEQGSAPCPLFEEQTFPDQSWSFHCVRSPETNVPKIYGQIFKFIFICECKECIYQYQQHLWILRYVK